MNVGLPAHLAVGWPCPSVDRHLEGCAAGLPWGSSLILMFIRVVGGFPLSSLL